MRAPLHLPRWSRLIVVVALTAILTATISLVAIARHVDLAQGAQASC
jgi:hypothetical protein